ncbi:adenosylcobinamide-phosphate synthase CbiB [Halobacillus sp. ACCC02827]|uniref:adenosylcobinamide-phosphate synthase CbiB n=1 Tax=Bacillaceae TaxID=186817 RepID=UPI000416FDCD|nr:MULTISPECIES: adenosylcobinamide-phosphate synthase CbiB [Bacillaceae]QHT45645.1 cobalamin biosynthesis protein CobD [Bacillus sp. SB49]WJE16444.1 adenosylcobinamide-phosphate synthase CbiB [Halobacillus sp. ACCC02827]
MDWLYHYYILLFAIGLDLWIGDPKWIPHPVIGIGKLIGRLEGKWNNGERLREKGVMLVIVIVGGAASISFVLITLAEAVHPVLAFLVEGYIVSSTIAIKGLQKAAYEVLVPLSAGNIEAAREKLSWIVGRDTEALNENEVTRGTVETVAENTVDAVIAPVLWALIGGGPLAFAYRAANTLDSMVGYKNDRYLNFGWASARFDDIVNWLPARVTAAAMWIGSFHVRDSRRKNGLVIVRRDAAKHPSPNAGFPEAMCAGLLGVRLGGVNFYEGIPSYRAELGTAGRKLKAADILITVRYMHGTWVVVLALVGIVIGITHYF